jgi:hypothetical protein
MAEAVVHVLRQIDVADSIDLERLAAILRSREPTRGAAVLRGSEPSPSAGVVLRAEPLDLRIGRRECGPFSANVRLRAFDFGVLAVRFTITAPDPSPAGLIQLSTQIATESAAFDRETMSLWQELSSQVKEAITPWEDLPPPRLIEDFMVFVLRGPPGVIPDDALAHVLLGEPANRKLAPSTVHEIASRVIRYYEDDLVAVDYDAAVVIEAGGAPDLVDIFEIVSAQLLELRFYDALLGRALGSLARDVRHARTAAWLLRSPFRKLSRRAASLALEIGEMTDRLERAITLVGDNYSVQIYREAALRVRMSESGAAVREKVGTIARVAEAIGTDVQGRRDLAVELLIVLLILIELFVAFRH